jgi:hypothetical protein
MGCEDSQERGCPDPVEPVRNHELVSINQGVWGDVWFWRGDFQPTCASGTITAASREVLLYERVNTDSVTSVHQGSPFYTEIRAKLLGTTHSDAMGFFQLELPTGDYSLFVREDSLFYANRGDGQGNIFPVSVRPDSVSGVRVDITYEASY